VGKDKKPKKGGIAVIISVGKPKGGKATKPPFPVDPAAMKKALTTAELREASRTGGISRIPGTMGGLSTDPYHGRGTKDITLTRPGAERFSEAAMTRRSVLDPLRTSMAMGNQVSPSGDEFRAEFPDLQPHEARAFADPERSLEATGMTGQPTTSLAGPSGPITDVTNKPELADIVDDAQEKPMPSFRDQLSQRSARNEERRKQQALEAMETARLREEARKIEEQIARNQARIEDARAEKEARRALGGAAPPPVAGSAAAKKFTAARAAQPKSRNPKRGTRRKFMSNAQKRNRQMLRRSEPMDLAFQLLKGWADSYEPSSEDDPEERRAREERQFEEFMRNLDDPEFAAGVEEDHGMIPNEPETPKTSTADNAQVQRLVRLLLQGKMPGMGRR
jgi:hypothetical protein